MARNFYRSLKIFAVCMLLYTVAYADTYTTNYNFRLPSLDVEDYNTPWGQKYNDNFTLIDTGMDGLVAETGDFMTGQLTTSSTMTVEGAAFSVGGNTFTIVNGHIGIGTNTLTSSLNIEGESNIFQLQSNGVSGRFLIALATGSNLAHGAWNDAMIALAATNDPGASDWRYFACTNSNDDGVFVIRGDGNVGIGTASPVYTLHVNGTVASTDTVTLSSNFNGDAVAALKGIKSRPSVNNWGHVDHQTIPSKVRREMVYKSEISSAVFDGDKEIVPAVFEKATCLNMGLPEGAECVQVNEDTVKVYGFSIPDMLALQRRAIQQLIERIEALEKK